MTCTNTTNTSTPTHRHGGPYDRGSADGYYHRLFAPHYYVGDTYQSARVPASAMSPQDLADYTQGYTDAAWESVTDADWRDTE